VSEALKNLLIIIGGVIGCAVIVGITMPIFESLSERQKKVTGVFLGLLLAFAMLFQKVWELLHEADFSAPLFQALVWYDEYIGMSRPMQEVTSDIARVFGELVKETLPSEVTYALIMLALSILFSVFLTVLIVRMFPKKFREYDD
jgi:hypothetical protein